MKKLKWAEIKPYRAQLKNDNLIVNPRDGNKCFGIMCDGHLVTFIGYRENKNKFWISYCWTNPIFRRKGMFSHLWKQVFPTLKEMGKNIEGYFTDDSKQFFKSQGFEFTKKVSDYEYLIYKNENNGKEN